MSKRDAADVRGFIVPAEFQAAVIEAAQAALAAELAEAEAKAWESLARYKFAMFGYWAGVWVHLNRVGRFGACLTIVSTLLFSDTAT